MNARELAGLTALSEATISRLASGDRRPSVETMGKVRGVLGWSMDEQADSLAAGTYAADFKQRMESRGVHAARSAVGA